MKKTIAILLSAVLLVSMLSIAVSAASWKNESDWTVVDEKGNVAFPNAYGYVFEMNYVDGTILGEDATMITNADAYAKCNPNWAISVPLKATETEGVYSVISVVAGDGSAPTGINWLDTKLVMVVHSSTSNPAEAEAKDYHNWKSKVAAVALTEGVLVKYEGAKVTVQNEDGAFPEAPADDESEAPAEKVLVNLAKGASYTTSQLYKQGGADVQWGWDENAAVAYPDEDNKSLTDGQKAANDCDYTDAAFAGFHAKAPDYIENGYSWITVDLGEVKSISNVSMNAGTSKNANLHAVGVASPHSVEYFVSNDGETWTSIGAVVPADGPEGTEDISVELAEAVDAQYVQARFTSEGWMFITEIEVEGYVEVAGEDTTPDAGDASSMIVFAVIALVALAGATVVVKTRR